MEAVKIWEQEVVIPTYEVGEADKNPIFLDKRVYQGSSGKIYPYPTIEKISNQKIDKRYKAVYLENEYLRVMILPELGGRIQRAYDKTNNYDFVYYNQVIKPALVGLVGPWISGGIEFNWPQHHRPTTFMPVDYMIRENKDGSKTLLTNDVDQMYGTKGITAFTLYPEKAYIEVKGQLYNRTPLAQTFLWWANPAIAANEYTQSIFPPDVHAVMDHGKRDVSRFPIATGVYYKHDYSEGVDISRYKNIPVPTSYMAEKSNYDFVGGYDYRQKAGILHVADHHISPGKKQWTWGCGDFGKAWDRNLTDEDGPYIELMTGVYTDNQPDFTWLKPFEEKSFRQYFMPYKAVGAVKNATIHAAINLEKRESGIYICIYATSSYNNVKVCLTYKGNILLEEVTQLSPIKIYEKTLNIVIKEEEELKVEVYAKDKLLVSYQPKRPQIEKMPKPAEKAKDPQDVMTNEELYLIGLHLEQYRHATYLPDPYYIEGLKRDGGDIRINNAYGVLLMRRGLFKEAEGYFRKAIERAICKNPNPYDSECYYNLGLVLGYQDRIEEAYSAFFKATWSNEQQEMAFYYLATIATKKGCYSEALELVDKGLIKNSHNIKARGLKTYILRSLSLEKEARNWISENLEIDGFDYLSMFELSLLESSQKNSVLNKINKLMRDFRESYLQVARDYAEFGAYKEAIEVLRECKNPTPIIYYYKAYYLNKIGKESKKVLETAEETCPDYCFPNKLEDIAVLEYAIRCQPNGAKAYYYLGNLFYDKRQFEVATKLFEKSMQLDSTFPIVLRNLAISYYNNYHNLEKAKLFLEEAFRLDPEDARIFLELDQLYKKLNRCFEERLQNYEHYKLTFEKRDDLFIEYITLHNLLGKHEEAYRLIMSRKFHPWEGGEGKITKQYTITLVQLAKKAIKENEFLQAKEYLLKALSYPQNLGEGKLEGTKDNDVYYNLGCIMEQMNQCKKAKEYFEKACLGFSEPTDVMYYNDQPADMVLYQGLSYKKLGNTTKANQSFYKLIDYGETHLLDKKCTEYFAVSLPDFLIFEENQEKKNKAHCYYLMGLGYKGLGQEEKSQHFFEKALKYDPNNLQYVLYKE